MVYAVAAIFAIIATPETKGSDLEDAGGAAAVPKAQARAAPAG